MRSQTTKKKLLSEDRTFDQALKVAQADELAEKESKLLQGNSDTSSAGILPVNAVHKKSFSAQESQRQTDPKSKMGGKQCFRCGSPQHLADKCSHVEFTCNYCGKPGHLAKACLYSLYEKCEIFWKFVNYTALIQTYSYNWRPGNPYGSCYGQFCDIVEFC